MQRLLLSIDKLSTFAGQAFGWLILVLTLLISWEVASRYLFDQPHAWAFDVQIMLYGALFMMAAPVAMMIGAPVSAALLKLDGRLGLHGWQWLFLVEGLPAVGLGLVALRRLPDRRRWPPGSPPPTARG